MRMGTKLLDAMGAGLPGKGDDLHGVGERTIRPDRQYRYVARAVVGHHQKAAAGIDGDRKSTRLNSSHLGISYAVFCLKKKKDTYYISSCILLHALHIRILLVLYVL